MPRTSRARPSLPSEATGTGGGPRRTCVGCRQVRAQAELLRVVRTDEGSLLVGRTLPGRGAWLCRGSLECLESATRTGGFARSFRTAVSPSATEGLRAAVLGDQEVEDRSAFVQQDPGARD